MSYSYNAYPWGRWVKWGILALVVIILVSSSISTYNGLAAANQDVQSKWSQVENVMQRRADNINNQVEVVKGYVKHEEKVFDDIAAARSVLYSGSSDVKSKLEADDKLAAAARSMLVLMENYPDLKASELFSNLQTEIAGSENRVSVERKRFIDSVQAYNTKVTRFPGSIFARLMGFSPKDYFQASPGAQEAPKVQF
ncbi:MAG: LemA family protein [Clostridiales bacterium]|nr:LemA family protein [Eubacteriales bacterium]MDH7567601.1 LemA family protein [Clostridiales bacterium]